MNKELIISYLKPCDIILSNYKNERIVYFNYNHITIYLGNNLRLRLDHIFENKIIFHNINNYKNYILDFSSNHINFITIEDFLYTKEIIKVYNIINYDLLTLNEYEDIVLQNKLIDKLIYENFNKNVDSSFNIIFKTLEELLSIKFNKRLFNYSEFILYNNNYFKHKLTTLL